MLSIEVFGSSERLLLADIDSDRLEIDLGCFKLSDELYRTLKLTLNDVIVL